MAEPLNIAVVPAHTLFALDAIEIEGVTEGVTVIVAAFEVTVFKPEHEFVEVNAQVTMSLFAKVVLVNVAPVAIFTPFTFHW